MTSTIRDSATRAAVKYQVFISSTYNDLRQERLALLDQVMKQDHIPAGMEMFAAGDEDSWQVIKKSIEMCDIYVVLVGARYGTWKDFEGTKISYTEREFRFAQETKKSIIAFLLYQDEEEFKRYRAEVEAEDPKEKEVHNEFLRFRESVKKIDSTRERLVGYFRKMQCENQLPSAAENPCLQQLINDFTHSLNKLIQSHVDGLTGWIRSDADLIKVGRVHDDPFIRPILDRLSAFSDLRDRNVQNSDLKSSMAELFWAEFGKGLGDSKIRSVFFESGSTLTYVSTKIKRGAIRDESDQSREVVSESFRKSLKASTNGILTYIDNLFFPERYGFNISLWPSGPPEGSYGATFGEQRVVEQEPLNKNDWKYINNKIKILSEKDLLLVTSSGVNLTKQEFPKGLHVGSYKNKIFKIAILKAPVLKIYFLDETKIDLEIRREHCRFVAAFIDPKTKEQASWVTAAAGQPISFCVGIRNLDSVNKLKSDFCEHLGLDQYLLISPEQPNNPAVLFLYNQTFADAAKAKNWVLPS